MDTKKELENVRIAMLDMEADVCLGKNMYRHLQVLIDGIEAANEIIDTSHPDDETLIIGYMLAWQMYRMRDRIYEALSDSFEIE